MQARQKSWVSEVWNYDLYRLLSKNKGYECTLSLYGSGGPAKVPFRLLHVERPRRGGNQVEILGQTSFRCYHMVPCKLVQRRRDKQWFFVIERSSYDELDQVVRQMLREERDKWHMHFGPLESNTTRLRTEVERNGPYLFTLHEEYWDPEYENGPRVSPESPLLLRERHTRSEKGSYESLGLTAIPVSIMHYEWNFRVFSDVSAILIFEKFTGRWILCVSRLDLIQRGVSEDRERLQPYGWQHEKKSWFTRFCEWWSGIVAR